MSILVTVRVCIAARRRRYNIQRLRAAAAFQRGASTSFPGAGGGDSDEGEDGEENDVEYGTGIRSPTRELAAHMQQQQQSGSRTLPTQPPKLPAVVLHPDLSTVGFAIKEENNTIKTEGQVNQQDSSSSTPPTIPGSPAAAPRRPPPAAAIFLFNGRGGGFRRSNTGQLRRQQRTSAPPPALVTVELDGSRPEEDDDDSETSSLENAEGFPNDSAAAAPS